MNTVQCARRRSGLVGLVVAAAVVTACSGETSGTSETVDTQVVACPEPDAADLTGITDERARLLLGFGEVAAERCAAELGWAFRVGARDGESFPLTMDYSMQRVTVEIAGGLVTAITVG